ncbi:unnamed protein product [Paramecium octaurelia]|uniref:Uncharacterized protein n=1 Tax=Paramecium octaurelia TaxID=43137 RepID=A0A8S1WDT5_PAROT|nr:unnamed protein product [Paramecium octaurelia]
MKTFVLIVLLGLALGVQVNEQATILQEALTNNLKATSMGRAVLAMVELGSPNFNPLFDALEAWASLIEQTIADENSSYGAFVQQVETEETNYKALIAQYENEVAEYNIQIREILKSRISLEEDLERTRTELGGTKQQKANIENQQRQDSADFKTRTSQLSAAIVVIDEALKVLDKAKYSSFVEEDAQQLSSLVSGTPELHTLLLQLNTEDYKSAQNLQKVINLLQNIRDQFNQNIQTLQAGFTAAQQQAQDLFELLNAKIDSLVKDVIPQLQQDIQGKDSEIDSRRQLANEAQANLDAARESLKQSIQEKGLATNSHNILISEYHSNLDTVAECISALHGSGIQRQ